jgi:hypothetical protein
VPSDSSPHFTASYDSTTKSLSAGLTVFLAAIAVVMHSTIALGVAAAILALAFAWSPRAYTVVDRAVVVERLIGKVSIPLDGIRAARRAAADDFAGCIRLWGNGGLFGYYGYFSTTKLGRSWWYLTNRRNSVVVITDRGATLFSPDDVDGFLAAIRASGALAGVPLVAPFLSPAQLGRGGGNRIAAMFVLPIAAIVIAVVAFAFLYAPGPPTYTLSATSLAIHDRFYPVTLSASSVDVEGIRVVDIGRGSDWRLTERTNGFANSHYRSGWFRAANGQKVRIYQAGGRRLVLLPPKGKGNAVLLEVGQPDQFVDELRRNWSNRS